MSEQAVVELRRELQVISALLPWMRGVIVGAFLLGSWVATLQIGQAQMRRDLDALTAERQQSLVEWRAWRETTTGQLTAMRAILERLERK